MKHTRPWVTSDEVRAYSELAEVQNRTDEKLAVDISRAEEFVINYTHNDFSEYETIPAAIKTAVILLSEMYGYNAIISSNTLKSETFDDYSYTAEASTIKIADTGVEMLLEPYVITGAKGRVTFRLRKL